MSTDTKPKRRYLLHGATPRAIAERKPFTNSTGNLRGGAARSWTSHGWLNEREAAMWRVAREHCPYTVWSFDTPIAWWIEDEGWHIVDQRFSVVTSTKHQSRLYLIPTWDDESVAYSLSDCKHWDTPGPECSGPRVGKVVRDGVILCEGHYNSKP